MPHPPRARLTWLVPCLILATASARADGDRPPVVAGFERFGNIAGVDPAEGGRLLIGELNCVACHPGDGSPLAPVASKRAPILDRVGSRVKVDHLRAYLADPRGVKPGTTMPDLFAARPKGEAADEVESLVHFLASTGSVAETSPARRSIASGRSLYNQAGCAACHGLVPASETSPSTVVPMGDVAGKYTVNSLAAFLLDPLASRPSGRMPALNLKPNEAQAVASFLLADVKVTTPGLAYRFYQGDWTELPDLDALKPARSGVAEGFDLGAAGRRNGYALRFEGVLEVVREGDYTFHLASDDGSKLWVDGKLVVNDDGIHPTQSASGRARLGSGRHPLVVGYFDAAGQSELEVEYEGPGIPRRTLAPDLRSPDGVPSSGPPPDRFVVDAEKAAGGRTLFASLGCASCHQLRERDRAVAPRPIAKPMAELRPDAGCLAESPPKGVPHFGLGAIQRRAIASALASPKRPTTDKEAIARTFVAFNCYGCHRREGVGGVEEGHDGAFATTQKEMGEEGRIPPDLSGIGGKLTDAWLNHVLADGAKDRPYMLTRMPKFGRGNVEHLVKPMVALDAVAPVPPVADFGLPDRKVKATGRFLVGSGAFNCGACHKFKESEGGGIQALDMTLMTRRLRRDWFHRYVVDPQLYRPGTRMPTAWPGGVSQLEAILGGNTPKQIESVWLYLSDGPDAPPPLGLGRDPIPLVADKGPIVYRNFLQGAGPRGIGVGYPEKANLAFDADGLRLALIWQGAFIDASKHWSGRGEGFQGPLGDNVLAMPAGPAFASLENDAAEWPRQGARELGGRFRGYRLDPAGKPVFLYDVANSVAVEDFPEAVTARDAPGLRRTIDLAGSSPGLYFRAAVAKTIEPRGDGRLAIDGEWTLRIASEGAPIVRNSAGKAELLVPVKFEGGKARIVEEFAW